MRRKAKTDCQASDFEEEENKNGEMLKEDTGRKLQMIGHKNLEIWPHKMQEKKCGKWSEMCGQKKLALLLPWRTTAFTHSSTWFDNSGKYALFLPTGD